jgi:hypothetical protein
MHFFHTHVTFFKEIHCIYFWMMRARVFKMPRNNFRREFFMLSHHAGGARRWDARPGRLHLRHQELQVQGGRDQADQQGKDHRIVLRLVFKTMFSS